MQITFHYVNGQSDSFKVGDLFGSQVAPQEIRQEMRRFLNDDWWVLKLREETVFIQANNVLKVEIKPSMNALEGEGVLGDAERITALTQGKRLM